MRVPFKKAFLGTLSLAPLVIAIACAGLVLAEAAG